MNAPYEEPYEETGPEPEPGGSLTTGAVGSWARSWLRRAHHPLPRVPSPEAFAALAARAERAGAPWIGWQEGETRFLAGGALASWSFGPRAAFQAAAKVSSAIRERVVVDPEAAASLRELPLLWHGFAFRAGPWRDDPQVASESWPGAELRLPAWLLYARGDQAGLVVHARIAPGEDPDAVQGRLNDRARALLDSKLDPRPAHTEPELRLVTREGEARAFQERVAALSDALNELPEAGASSRAKVVLSRRAQFASERPFDAAATWQALAERPGVRAFAWSRGEEGVLVGASPELLVALRGEQVLSEALAGTAPLAEAEWLAADPKNAREHALVIQTVAEVLRETCGSVERGPTGLRRLQDLVHLQTSLSAPRRPEHDLLALAAALHPTPALGGSPRAFALPWLAAEERGWFGAPLGYSDQAGGGELLITIRSALLRGDRAELFAGAGILPESDPASEWRETELKLRAAAAALRVREPEDPA